MCSSAAPLVGATTRVCSAASRGKRVAAAAATSRLISHEAKIGTADLSSHLLTKQISGDELVAIVSIIRLYHKLLLVVHTVWAWPCMYLLTWVHVRTTGVRRLNVQDHHACHQCRLGNFESYQLPTKAASCGCENSALDV